jgi:hypothetical protein
MHLFTSSLDEKPKAKTMAQRKFKPKSHLKYLIGRI